MEELLRELISVNREMLMELRMLRQALCREAGADFALEAEPEIVRSEPFQPGALKPEAPKSPPPRYTPQDLEDIHGTLLEGIKKRNKDKSDAFSEFEKRHKNW